MTRWIGTSWKMNKTVAQARDYARGLRSALEQRPELLAGVQPFIIPPHTALTAVAEELGPESARTVRLGAQNAHWEDDGAWTGEISVPQVADAGASLVEIGHSERREHFGETIETTRLKVASTLRHGLIPLLCIGEPAEVQSRGETADYLLDQARGALRDLSADQLSQVLIAYEPIWAIGAQGRPATVAELREPFEVLSREYGGRVQALLYGGSVSTDNAAQLLELAGVEGLFVGRAAWTLEGYLNLLEIAAEASKP
ncbi:triose-phosphate isomerase [Nesterenkonia sandarakina]|uniref:Triosephosphate isomerase n=1 Tax=Nesterenkonia sandarakina TaxID=272918 RepID=A0A2T0YQS2_9MICC|nr:triose-phosphate isomerase [Nesterenkonia sandarakina]PRZ17728.1 triosephosphate isomerase [Nesterenkonia sandarakina]